MRLLVVQPGASFSTSDVHEGLIGALRERGHDLREYNLERRVELADNYLHWLWRRSVRDERISRDTPKPTMPDVIRRASMEILEAVGATIPDAVLVTSGMFLHPDAVIMLHRFGVPVCVVLTESPYDDAMQGRFAAHASLVFTNERGSVDLLRRERFQDFGGGPERVWGNANTHYLPHAIDPSKHGRHLMIENEHQVPSHDVVFVGSGFMERQELLAAVDWKHLGIDFGLYGTWKYLGSRNRLRPYLRGGVTPNAYAAALYRHARVGLNLYRQSVGFARNATRIVDGAQSLNPRALELAANGCVHVSDYRPEVETVFGSLVPTFKPQQLSAPEEVERAATELSAILVDLLADDARRADIAMRLPFAVEDRTFARSAEIVERELVRTLDTRTDVDVEKVTGDRRPTTVAV